MPEAKTLPNDASVAAFLAAVDDPQRRADAQQLVRLMQQATGEPPVLWGSAIVGFGRYHYRYASGHEGDSCLVGFSPRKGDISVYLQDGFDERADLLARLGRHKLGKVCLYLRRLADVDMAVLADLIGQSVAEMRRRHP